MQPSHTRLICRAHNRFTPSTALWQHFVVPNRPARHQRRLASSTPETLHNGADAAAVTGNGLAHQSQDANGPTPSEVEVKKEDKPSAERTWKLRKPTTAKGQWFSDKKEASAAAIERKRKVDQRALQTQSEELLAIARAAYSDAKDYVGVVVKPMVAASAIKESALPWCFKTEDKTVPGKERLNIEIEKFYEYTKPGKYEAFVRKHLIEQVSEDVRGAMTKYVVEVFGSERTGIAFATSDIDFRLVRAKQVEDPIQAKLPPTPEERREALTILRTIHNKVFGKRKGYLLSAIRHARYPLISAQDRHSGIDVQIVSSNDTTMSRVIMKGYMEEYPYLRQLYYVIKTMLDVRGLSDVFRGGIGSYSLFMMVVASIKHAPKPPENAAAALIHFLRFWRDFDTTKHGVSIEPAMLFDKKEHLVMSDTVKSKLKEGITSPLPPYMLTLRDPADETNDLGRKGIAIKHVQATFKFLSHHLEFDMRVNTRPSLLGPLVGTSYMLDLGRRRKIQRYGEHLMRQMQASLSEKARAVREADNMQAAETEVVSEEAKRQMEAEEAKERLAREERDREWQRLANEQNELSKAEARKSAVLDHGEAMASILGMPAVEEEVQSEETRAAQIPESNVQQTEETKKA